MVTGPSIFPLVGLRDFCQLEYIHTLTEKCVYLSLPLNTVSIKVYTAQLYEIYIVKKSLGNFCVLHHGQEIKIRLLLTFC
jgi:predicted CDP-diglyceride synthetase/phosphatidate cytidylyltransferase